MLHYQIIFYNVLTYDMIWGKKTIPTLTNAGNTAYSFSPLREKMYEAQFPALETVSVSGCCLTIDNTRRPNRSMRIWLMLCIFWQTFSLFFNNTYLTRMFLFSIKQYSQSIERKQTSDDNVTLEWSFTWIAITNQQWIEWHWNTKKHHWCSPPKFTTINYCTLFCRFIPVNVSTEIYWRTLY